MQQPGSSALKSNTEIKVSPKIVYNSLGKVDRDKLIESFSSFVRSIAFQIKKSLSTRVEIDDLIAYGITGLLEAAERYDPQYGANFTTFSYYRIKGAIYDGLRTMGWVSRSEYQKIRFGEKATQYLENVAKRETIGAVSQAEQSNIEALAEQVGKMVTIYVTSLEGMQDREFEDTDYVRQDEAIEKKELIGLVHTAINALPEQDRMLIELYYFKNLSLEDVGKQIGLSKSWTCRKHASAIDKLTKIIQKVSAPRTPPPSELYARV